MAFSDGSSVPLSVYAESASPHEVTLVEATLERSFLKEKPERLIGDKAYDSDHLDKVLFDEGLEMSVPHRKNRKKKKTQDITNPQEADLLKKESGERQQQIAAALAEGIKAYFQQP